MGPASKDGIVIMMKLGIQIGLKARVAQPRASCKGCLMLFCAEIRGDLRIAESSTMWYSGSDILNLNGNMLACSVGMVGRPDTCSVLLATVHKSRLGLTLSKHRFHDSISFH